MESEQRKVLEGVPPLGWGKNIECTFFGALDATLRFLGEPVDYVYLMGVSAAAFRLRFHQPDWCPSSPDAALDETYGQQALKSIGYSGQFISTETASQEEINRITREEIMKGIPVVSIDLVRVPDWGVVTGYQGSTFLCRSYYDEGNEYSAAEKEPWAILKLEKIRSKPDRLESIRQSFKLAVELANKKQIDHYANGLAAFDAWIRDLENEAMFRKLDEATFRRYWHVNGWVYDSLFDARLAAAKYLQRVEKESSGNEREAISEAARRFDGVKTALFDNWIYFTLPHWVNKKEAKTWTPKGTINTDNWGEEMRKKGAETLRMVKQEERQAFEVLSRMV